MPENPGLYLRLTVTGNRGLLRRPVRAARPATADRAGAGCGQPRKPRQRSLRQPLERPPATRRLARTLLSDPAILFLDEPTSGLDPVASREVHDLIDGLRRRGVTVFLTTHRLEEAERLRDRVAILNTKLRAIGRPDELRDRLFTKTLLVRTADPLPDPAQVFAVPGVEGSQPDGTGGYVLRVHDARIAAPNVTRALVAAGADLLSLTEGRHTLEEVYLELIADDVEAIA